MNLLKFISSGKVQGVYYRKHITQAMNKEGYIGYIKNLADGKVETVVENNNIDINKILDILYKGSEKSDVKIVEMIPIDKAMNLNKTFEVRY